MVEGIRWWKSINRDHFYLPGLYLFVYMTLLEIHKQLLEYGFKDKNTTFIITDKDYARPTSNYLLGKFYEFYRQLLTEHKLATLDARCDCDNFASTFYVFAQICHTKSKRKEQGIAIGELFYFIDNGGGHVINIAFTEKGIMLIEPQDGKEVQLTQTEIESAMLIRF